ncbi:MAG: dienelactone hydrolase family protein [bacterium]
MGALLRCVEVETGPAPVGTVIWLHGLGADGHDFEPIVPALRLGIELRFVFPHAPHQPVTINGGMVMPAWYDILELSIQRHVDAAGVERSRQAVEALIAAERARGVAASRIVIAGFSQGGAMALDIGLRHAERLGGILCLSAYLARPDALAAVAANRPTPVLMGHGLYDQVVPRFLGQQSAEALQGAGLSVDWRTYPVEHGLHPREVDDIGRWLEWVYA